MLADIQELNEDTITSLRHFLTTSKMAGQPTDSNFASWLANNVPGLTITFDKWQPYIFKFIWIMK